MSRVPAEVLAAHTTPWDSPADVERIEARLATPVGSGVPFEDDLRSRRSDWLEVSRLAPAPEHAPVESGPVVTCGCGTSHTLGSFRALPLLSATDRTEGFTAIHDESRLCKCGPVLVTTKRLLGERR